MRHGDGSGVLTRRGHGRLVHQVLEVGAGEAGRRGGDDVEIDVAGQGNLSGVHVEDGAARGAIGQLQGDMAIEAPGPQQRRVEHVGPVGGGQHDDRLVPGKAVQLGQDLVEGLLALVVAAAQAGAAHPPHGVELVDEDDGRRALLRLVEHLAHARGADPDIEFDELRGRGVEEIDVRLTGERAGEQRLAGPRWPHEEHATGRLGAELAVAFRVAQEVHQLGDLALGVVLPGDVVEGDAALALALLSGRTGKKIGRRAAAEAPGDIVLHPVPEPEIKTEQEDPGQDPEQPSGRTAFGPAADDDILFLQ